MITYLLLFGLIIAIIVIVFLYKNNSKEIIIIENEDDEIIEDGDEIIEDGEEDDTIIIEDSDDKIIENKNNDDEEIIEEDGLIKEITELKTIKDEKNEGTIIEEDTILQQFDGKFKCLPSPYNCNTIIKDEYEDFLTLFNDIEQFFKLYKNDLPNLDFFKDYETDKKFDYTEEELNEKTEEGKKYIKLLKYRLYGQKVMTTNPRKLTKLLTLETRPNKYYDNFTNITPIKYKDFYVNKYMEDMRVKFNANERTHRAWNSQKKKWNKIPTGFYYTTIYKLKNEISPFISLLIWTLPFRRYSNILKYDTPERIKTHNETILNGKKIQYLMTQMDKILYSIHKIIQGTKDNDEKIDIKVWYWNLEEIYKYTSENYYILIKDLVKLLFAINNKSNEILKEYINKWFDNREIIVD